jgi:hypothetical protein
MASAMRTQAGDGTDIARADDVFLGPLAEPQAVVRRRSDQEERTQRRGYDGDLVDPAIGRIEFAVSLHERDRQEHLSTGQGPPGAR